MRRILIERTRRRVAAKRGAGAVMVDLDEIEIPSPVADDDQLLAVYEALDQFVDRYLADNDCSHRLYLVAWFSLNSWSRTDKRRKQVKFPNREALGDNLT